MRILSYRLSAGPWGRHAIVVAACVAGLVTSVGWRRIASHPAPVMHAATIDAIVSRGLQPMELALPAGSASGSPHGRAAVGPLPALDRAVAWLNSGPVTDQSLRGKVVLVDFWTYSCINSLRALPYVKSWAAKYKDVGLVVIGVHTPEFSFEKVRANVEWAVGDLQVTYPVPMDNDYGIWQGFNNEYWPADYLIDGSGKVRYHHFGEGDYGQSEREIQKLLEENGATGVSTSSVVLSPVGIEAPPSGTAQSPESYLGYRRAEEFASPERVARDLMQRYSAPLKPALNQWGLSGSWEVGGESAVLGAAPGAIVFRFQARDLHLVLAPTKDGKPVRFKVTLDGVAPGADAGVDTAPDGSGIIRQARLYQLIRQKGRIGDRTFEIEFLDPGVQAYVFTFG